LYWTGSGRGNSSAIRSYHYMDAQLDRSVPVTYYRLRQVDNDGSFAYSRAVQSAERNQ